MAMGVEGYIDMAETGNRSARTQILPPHARDYSQCGGAYGNACIRGIEAAF